MTLRIPHTVPRTLRMVGAVCELRNTNVKTLPLRTFVTITGRKQAMQVPPVRRTPDRRCQPSLNSSN